MTIIHPGQEIVLQATFQVLNVQQVWVPTDPATVLFYIKGPTTDKVTTATYGVDPSVVKVSTGVYTYTVIPHIPGEWKYGYESTGSGAAAAETSFRVSDSLLYT